MPPPLTKTFHEWMQLVMRHSIRNFMLFAKDRNYSIAQLNTLIRLFYKGECGISDLGEEMGVTNAAASQLLEKLVQQGLVQRMEDQQDRRHKIVMLTEAGKQIARQSLSARQSWLSQLIDLLTPEEQERVSAVLQLLIDKAALLEKT